MIFILAGVNGAGKSSIGGSSLRSQGLNWYNPDEIALEMQLKFPDERQSDVNSRVWHEGRHRLETAIGNDSNLAFETTLGGSTITNTLLDAIAAGVKLNVWYCGLDSPERHIERVAARVARGGHDIPEDLIRSRCQPSMQNLCRLTPGLHQLAVYDNSLPLDDHGHPRIRQLLHMKDDKVSHLDPEMPAWAKPVAAVCLQRTSAK